MRYVDTRFKTDARELAYRFYVTNGLQIISKNTATASIEGGEYLTQRFSDIYVKKNNKTEEEIEQDAEDIKAEVKNKIKFMSMT